MDGVSTSAGGSALNAIRAANFMLSDTHPKATTYFGCVGRDDYARTLEEELEKNGVNFSFHKDDSTPTGTCAVVVRGKERTLCANLGACLKYPKEHLLDNINAYKNAKLIYTTAFFISSNYEAQIELAKYAAEHNKPLGFNLSAGFLIRFSTE